MPGWGAAMSAVYTAVSEMGIPPVRRRDRQNSTGATRTPVSLKRPRKRITGIGACDGSQRGDQGGRPARRQVGGSGQLQRKAARN